MKSKNIDKNVAEYFERKEGDSSVSSEFTALRNKTKALARKHRSSANKIL